MSEIVSFGEWVQKRRNQLGFSRTVLAKQIGCAPITIKKIERDERRPSEEMADLFAQHLQIPENEYENFIRRARGEFIGQFDSPVDMPLNGKERIRQASHNVPKQPTPFIGRNNELLALDELIAEQGLRLVSIVGPGGMGKSRLAVAMAEQQLAKYRFKQGIFFVSLAPLSEAENIPAAIAEAIDFSLDSGGQQRRTPRQQILDYLREKEMLLVFDNFEHLLDGTELVADILQAARKVQILTTTRERLQLQEEQVYPIQGLEFPEWETPEDAAEYTAVRLFVQSAQRVQPYFSLQSDDLTYLSRICRLVAGMPLGIELAAGWVDTLSLVDIANEIQQSLDFLETEARDVPERHRSIRAVFDATWQRLNIAEQAIFPQLSVFRAGFMLKAGQEITSANLRTLGSLVNKSLLRYDRKRDRYQIHELLRQYGVEKLAEDRGQEITVYDQFSAYYCSAMQKQLPRLQGVEHQLALSDIEDDLQNVNIAWEWALKQKQEILINKALPTLGYFYKWQGRYAEGLEIFKHACESLPEGDNKPAYILSLAWYSQFLFLTGRLIEAKQFIEQAVKELNQTENLDQLDSQEKAFVCFQSGQVNISTISSDQLISITSYFLESANLYQESGDEWGAAEALAQLGDFYNSVGDFKQSDDYCSKALNLYRRLKYQRGVAETLAVLSRNARYRGMTDRSEELAFESLEIYERLGYPPDLARGLASLGIAMGWSGKPHKAEELLTKSLAIYEDIGDSVFLANNYIMLAAVYESLDMSAKAQRNLKIALKLSQESNSISQKGFALAILGQALITEGKYAQAAHELKRAIKIVTSLNDLPFTGRNNAVLSHCYLLMGKDELFKVHFLEGLQIGITVSDFLSMAYALMAFGQYLLKDNQIEKALKIYSACSQTLLMSKSGGYYRKLREPFLEVLEALPAERVEDIVALGSKLNILEMAKSILQEKKDLGWGEST